MEGIIFTGIQASGKSTFYKEYFFTTHVRISLDLLNTRNKEQKFLGTCFELHQRVVIDNTNPTVVERKKYIDLFRKHKYKIVSYYFRTNVQDALRRNKGRVGKLRIPDKGIWATFRKLETPEWEEGFDEMYEIKITANSFSMIEYPPRSS